jgi:hypothetical protein
VSLSEAATVTVGALGEVPFKSGWDVYAGSARGPGGFARLARRREVAAGVRDVRHPHVDSLLDHEAAAGDVERRDGAIVGADGRGPVGDGGGAVNAPRRRLDGGFPADLAGRGRSTP